MHAQNDLSQIVLKLVLLREKIETFNQVFRAAFNYLQILEEECQRSLVILAELLNREENSFRMSDWGVLEQLLEWYVHLAVVKFLEQFCNIFGLLILFFGHFDPIVLNEVVR